MGRRRARREVGGLSAGVEGGYREDGCKVVVVVRSTERGDDGDRRGALVKICGMLEGEGLMVAFRRASS